jgi:hypothetical protein
MVYLLPDGSWVDDLQEPVSLTPGHTVTATTALSLVEKRYGIDSPEWYAAEILWCIKQVRDFWAQGKNERAVLAGIWLGSLMAEADLKVQWDKPAMSGDKFYASGQKSVQTKKGKAATRYEKIRVMADAYRTMHPTARDTQIAAHIYRTWHPPEDRPSERTIRRAISNRHLAR